MRRVKERNFKGETAKFGTVLFTIIGALVMLYR